METTRDIDGITIALNEFATAIGTNDEARQTVALVGVLAPVMGDIRRAANALDTISKFELTRIGDLVLAGARDKAIDEATDAIAAWILANVDGEPSNPEQGAVATMARLMAEGRIAHVTTDEATTLSALRAGTLAAVSYAPPPPLTPSIVGIPDNAPFSPGPGGITPADKRFIPYSGPGTGTMPFLRSDNMIMWHDGTKVYGPTKVNYMDWSNLTDPQIKAYFVVD